MRLRIQAEDLRFQPFAAATTAFSPCFAFFGSLEGIFSPHSLSSYFQTFILFLLRYNRFKPFIHLQWLVSLTWKSVS